jgi:hypothetical protein
MSIRGAKSSPASFSDIQAVPLAILVPADSSLRFSQLAFEAVMYVDYNKIRTLLPQCDAI